jgi:hypothetical protein
LPAQKTQKAVGRQTATRRIDNEICRYEVDILLPRRCITQADNAAFAISLNAEHLGAVQNADIAPGKRATSYDCLEQRTGQRMGDEPEGTPGDGSNWGMFLDYVLVKPKRHGPSPAKIVQQSRIKFAQRILPSEEQSVQVPSLCRARPWRNAVGQGVTFKHCDSLKKIC